MSFEVAVIPLLVCLFPFLEVDEWLRTLCVNKSFHKQADNPAVIKHMVARRSMRLYGFGRVEIAEIENGSLVQFQLRHIYNILPSQINLLIDSHRRHQQLLNFDFTNHPNGELMIQLFLLAFRHGRFHRYMILHELNNDWSTRKFVRLLCNAHETTKQEIERKKTPNPKEDKLYKDHTDIEGRDDFALVVMPSNNRFLSQPNNRRELLRALRKLYKMSRNYINGRDQKRRYYLELLDHELKFSKIMLFEKYIHNLTRWTGMLMEMVVFPLIYDGHLFLDKHKYQLAIQAYCVCDFLLMTTRILEQVTRFLSKPDLFWATTKVALAAAANLTSRLPFSKSQTYLLTSLSFVHSCFVNVHTLLLRPCTYSLLVLKLTGQIPFTYFQILLPVSVFFTLLQLYVFGLLQLDRRQILHLSTYVEFLSFQQHRLALSFLKPMFELYHPDAVQFILHICAFTCMIIPIQLWILTLWLDNATDKIALLTPFVIVCVLGFGGLFATGVRDRSSPNKIIGSLLVLVGLVLMIILYQLPDFCSCLVPSVTFFVGCAMYNEKI